MKKKHAKKRKYTRRGGKPFSVKKETVLTVAAIWFWLIAITICFSFFGTAPFLTQIHDELVFRFGILMYTIPPYLIIVSLLFFKIKSPVAKPPVGMGLGLIFLAILTMTQSGEIGETINQAIAQKVGLSMVIFGSITVIVIGLLLVFNSSLDSVVQFVLNFFQSMTQSIGSRANKLVSPKDEAFKKVLSQPMKINGLKDEKDLKVDKKNEKTFVQAPVPIHTANMGGLKEDKSNLKINMPMSNNPGDMTMWEYPPLTLLSDGPGGKADRGDIRQNAHTIEETLASFGIEAKVSEVNPGPAVTQYALRIALGTKVSKITALSSDIAMALAAPTGSVRVEAPIPGRDLIGIEAPNRGLEFVTLKHMMQDEVFRKAKSKLSVALGLDVSGKRVVGDIARMPHVLVAGTTGSGKSVLINAWIVSLLFRTTPAEVRLIMIDPKRVELTGYNGIPHLLTPVIVEPDKILSSLRWAVAEMENRYTRFAEVSVRNIEGFNELSGFQAMPYIVIFIDELADLMAYAASEVEDAICRLAQKARAAGIHLVLSTQRPSVDVITGLIKANVPSRIAFNVSSMVDSRVVLDQPGAEKLLGRGDMLYIPADSSKPNRIQGTYISDKEVSAVVNFLKNKNPPVNYTEEVITQTVSVGKKNGSGGSGGSDGRDALFEQALRLVCEHDKASASLLQRRLKVGYARAARILDELEEEGVISAGEGAKPRDVLIKSFEEFEAVKARNAGE